MTKHVLNDYEISKDTLALIPAKHVDYYTIVIEKDQQLYVKKTTRQLIEPACLEGGASYEGRRDAVSHQIGVRNKVPIPINPREDIYAFPTHSPKQFECSWIFFHHIKSIKPHQKASNQSIVTFKNDQHLSINVSFSTLERQMHRTSFCIVRFSGRFDPPRFFGA
ncbi:competence protein ComK [Alkalihalobacillus deserti]|uniref:competence protein ComK n=1 Tax=Alkalihalobacillus deserti TaxID=2879466 RepID=UPI001D140BF1|nr:competence protein ComK [Alkalihalobacillus deserti]